MKDFAAKYETGCGHISACHQICNKMPMIKALLKISSHWMFRTANLDYMQKYLAYVPKIVSIELENSFAAQLKAKKYLEGIINKTQAISLN
jgi:hypothetical protein